MKKVIFLFAIIWLTGCSSTRLIDSWKNTSVASYHPDKILVVGMTDNVTARRIFEDNLKKAFTDRGINALAGSEVFDTSFTASKKTEEEIDALKSDLLSKGFDAVIITAVIGVDDKTDYQTGHYNVDYRWYRFGRYYYRFQDVYYNPGYYNSYKVYRIETSIYNLKENEAKSLVWAGTFEIVDPHGISATVNDYVKRIITQLERDQVLEK